MSVLIAGDSGLVGSALSKEFREQEIDFQGINSKSLNLTDRSATFAYIKREKPEVVICTASKVGGIVENDSFPVDFLSRNLQIQVNLFDACAEFSVKKLIFLGSSCVYPRECPQPIREDYLLTGPLEKTNSAYAVSKIAGIELIKAYRKQFNKDWISVMPCNMYGPNDNFDLSSSHVIPALIHKFVRARQMKNSTVKLLGTGNPLREFLFVDDFAKALVLIMKSYSSDVPINVGTGEEITIRSLAQTIAQIVGFEGEISWDDSAPDGTNRKVLDISKIRGFGWSPKYSLVEGLTITVDWFLRNKKVVV